MARDPRACYVSGGITNVPDPRAEFARSKEFLQELGWRPYLPTEHSRSGMCLIESKALGDAFREGPIYQELMRDFFNYIVNQASAVFLLPNHVDSVSACLERDVGKAVGLLVSPIAFAAPPVLSLAETVVEVSAEAQREHARQHPPRGGLLSSLEPTAPPVPSWPAQISPWTPL